MRLKNFLVIILVIMLAMFCFGLLAEYFRQSVNSHFVQPTPYYDAGNSKPVPADQYLGARNVTSP